MMDGAGLDSFKHSLIPRNFRYVCVSLQYWIHKEHIFADICIQAKKSLISKKEKCRLIGPELAVSVIWGAGPVELPMEKKKKRCVFLWFEWVQLHLPAS